MMVTRRVDRRDDASRPRVASRPRDRTAARPPAPAPPPGRRLIVIQLQIRPVVHLVILQRDVILVHGVPLLHANLLRPRARLRGDEFLQVPDRVVLAARRASRRASVTVIVTVHRASRRAARRTRCDSRAFSHRRAHLHLTRIFFPSRSLSVISIIPRRAARAREVNRSRTRTRGRGRARALVCGASVARETRGGDGGRCFSGESDARGRERRARDGVLGVRRRARLRARRWGA